MNVHKFEMLTLCNCTIGYIFITYVVCTCSVKDWQVFGERQTKNKNSELTNFSGVTYNGFDVITVCIMTKESLVTNKELTKRKQYGRNFRENRK